jgi:hypothetical protein
VGVSVQVTTIFSPAAASSPEAFQPEEGRSLDRRAGPRGQ